MMLMAFREGVLVVVVSLGAVVPESAGIGRISGEAERGPDRVRVGEALSRGAGCLERDRDGASFRDPYLTYVYPGERLPAPPGAPPLTYRNVDAAAILLSIGEELGASGDARAALAPMIDQAEAAIGGAVATWRGRGFSNVRVGAQPGGIALDTYCTVGWLKRDAIMAEEAGAALHGDGWLPEALYDAGDEFRLIADESWCLRLLAATGRFGRDARRLLERHAAVFRDHARERPGDMGTFYEALHLGMVLAEPSLRPTRPRLLDEVVAALRGWAAAHAPGGGTEPRDLLEWANLASADVLRIPSVSAGDRLRGRAVRIVLDMQQDDGCWASPDARPPRAGATFMTLRAVLALAEWSGNAGEDAGSARGPGKVRQSEAGPGEGANPAPQARRPAQ
jgi:hypothetical protein